MYVERRITESACTFLDSISLGKCRVKLSENDLNEIKQLTGRENALAKFNKNSTRKMRVANQRMYENEILALLLKTSRCL